ncbi:MAG: HD-GYP domain-containing protein [Chitinispirillaceae bacterium]|nr:HD-GYP domain-containing protein [Chitinispirillaceae bacterium]
MSDPLQSHLKISVDEIEVGMELQDVFTTDGKLLLSSMIITSQDQIESLRRKGVTFAYIKPTDTASPPEISASVNSEADQTLQREKAYYQELSKAKEVHQATLEAARNTLHDARFGKPVAIEAITTAAEEMVSSIMRNPDALVSLAQIKGYDEYTYVHSVNVGILITSLVHSMNYSEEQLLEAGIGGLLHDIGKMRVPEHILNKPGKYTNEEFSIMKRHPENGLAILKNSNSISDFSKLVLIEHHERYNGKGYPKGLNESNIHEIGLIAAVSDVYDAMTTDRIYRPAWTPQRTLAMIFQGCDIDYSRRIVELFTKNLGIYPVGSFVRLASGEMGVVIRVDKGSILTPDVLILFDGQQQRLDRPREYKLSELQKNDPDNRYRIELSLNSNDYNIRISDYISANPFN